MSSKELLLNAIFYAFALTALGGAIAVALSKNIVRSAFSLLAVLFSTAAFYAIMKADFIMAAQILIYVGGILILIIFAIMLTHRITDVKISNESTPGPVPFLAVTAVLIVLGGMVLSYPAWKKADMSDEALVRKYEAAAGEIGAKIAASRPKDAPAPAPAKPIRADSLTKVLATGLMTKFLLAFEVISVLLLAALIGAAFLARKEVRA